MPLRTAAIRRCGFKLPKNDKYQCQKAGDKFQPIVKLWYCTIHDRHAQDRCQVLVEWAGKGAQCEQLGAFDESRGKKLCEWHVMQSKREGWLERKGAEPKQRKDSTQESVGPEVAAISDNRTPDESAPPSSSPSEATEDATNEALCYGQTSVESHRLLPDKNHSTGSESPEQVPSAEEHFNDAKAFLHDEDSDPGERNLEDPTITATEETTASQPTPILQDDTVEERSAPATLLSINAINDSNVRKPSDKPRDLTRAARTRVDSLGPFQRSPPTQGSTATSTPTIIAHSTSRSVTQSPQTTGAAHNTTPRSQLVHTRINFLNALRDDEASFSDRTAAVYAQCCVCLEKHGEYNTREVQPCKHRYRDLCLRKATKMGSLRRFNCASCRAWMAEQQENMIENGKL